MNPYYTQGEMTLWSLTCMEIAKRNWTKLEPYFTINERVEQRKRIVIKLTKNPFFKENCLPVIYYIENAVKEATRWFSTFRGFLDYFDLSAEFFNKESPFYYMNFFDTYGHFLDVNWARGFVADEMQCPIGRFYVAAFYCFRPQIQNLYELILEQEIPLEQMARGIPQWNLVSHWLSFFQNNTLVLAEFNKKGFLQNYILPRSARYFWDNLDNAARQELLNRGEIDTFIQRALQYGLTQTALYIISEIDIGRLYANTREMLLNALSDSMHLPFFELERLPFRLVPQVSITFFSELVEKVLKVNSIDDFIYITLNLVEMWTHATYVQQYAVLTKPELVGPVCLKKPNYPSSVIHLGGLIIPLIHLLAPEKKTLFFYSYRNITILKKMLRGGFMGSLNEYMEAFIVDRNPNKYDLRKVRVDRVNFLMDVALSSQAANAEQQGTEGLGSNLSVLHEIVARDPYINRQPYERFFSKLSENNKKTLRDIFDRMMTLTVKPIERTNGSVWYHYQQTHAFACRVFNK